MRVYISGKITGTTDYRERFEAAEGYLRGLGHEPVNPVWIGYMVKLSMPFEPQYETYMAIDLAVLQECDAIYFLKGYEDSNGSRREHTKAAALGLRVFYEGDNIPEE